MPITLNSASSNSSLPPCKDTLCAKRSPECVERSSRNLRIGLINNMPDAALEATERQFTSLLESASDKFSICLSLYALPGIQRSEAGARHISERYKSTDTLPGTELDALIVTGREPLKQNLADEPYWESFTGVLEWARNHTHSTIWSCLAAHAAVQYMDDIRRVRSQRKHCGALRCTRVTDHPLTEGLPLHFQLPHSRWNGIPEEELEKLGYLVLSRTADAGVDAFCKPGKSLFVFFQGHPEYESATLLLEYRRDVSRYLSGESPNYPSLPQGYFDPATISALAEIQTQAISHRNSDLLRMLSGVLEKVTIENTWRPTAISIYRQWLQHLYTQKKQSLQNREESEPTHMTSSSLVSVNGEGPLTRAAVLSSAYQSPGTTLVASRNAPNIL